MPIRTQVTINPKPELTGFKATDDLLLWKKLVQIALQGPRFRRLADGFIRTICPENKNAPLALVYVTENE